ncbi:MAG TPA: Cof-type HAD-IIB family hydrolase [Virgibacillus sp.]|nr:Cof-type HAD-IIB family hydrolase [Virgibacillus sp.]HLR69104.1 Cof-type HAD-IIB family hydrolase [Virgibacillus sp.]
MIKCIAIDMDGTLLNNKMEISPLNQQAMKAAQTQGIEVVIATGRAYREAADMLKEADLSCPIISMNGTEVRRADGELIAGLSLDKKIASNIIDILDDEHIYTEVHTNQGGFTVDPKKRIRVIIDVYQQMNVEAKESEIRAMANERLKKGYTTIVDNFHALFQREEIQLFKMISFSKDRQKLKSIQKKLHSTKEIIVTSSGKFNMEITDRNGQKGIALKKFTDVLGIDLNETMAIGDNYNDQSMLEIVGRSVAMENGEQGIKKICTHTTCTNEEDGVAKAIDEVLQEQGAL